MKFNFYSINHAPEVNTPAIFYNGIQITTNRKSKVPISNLP